MPSGGLLSAWGVLSRRLPPGLPPCAAPLPCGTPEPAPGAAPLPSPSPRWPRPCVLWGLLSAWGVLSFCFTSVPLPGGTPAPAPGAAPRRPLTHVGPAPVPPGVALGLGRSVPLPFPLLAPLSPAPGSPAGPPPLALGVASPLRLPSLVVPLPLVPSPVGSGALYFGAAPQGKRFGRIAMNFPWALPRHTRRRPWTGRRTVLLLL